MSAILATLIGAREAPMPKAVRPGPSPPKAAKRAKAPAAPRPSPERVEEIFRRFAAANPEPKGELEYVNPYTLLVAVVLSAQATDAGVNKATRGLFKAADTPKKMVALGLDEVQERIKTIGLYRNKAKNVIALSEKLMAEHGGEVPHEREALEALPGVGRKTANVVLNIAFGEPTLAVDTHVFRVAHRLDLRLRQDAARGGAGPAEGHPGEVPAATPTTGSSCTAATSARPASRAAMPVSFATCAIRPTSGSIAAPPKVASSRESASMTVGNGRQFLSIPGPTNVPDEVLAAMQRPAIDIYSGEMIGITDSCLADLQTIFRTKGRIYIYAANGHGGWEAAFTNVLSRGDTVLVLESGRFAARLGRDGADDGRRGGGAGGRAGAAPSIRRRVEERLKRDKGHAIKAILVVQIDTASGVVNDIPAIRKAMDAAKHPALLMVDGVASLGCMPFDMDAWGIDVAMSGSQKGLMTPPGLAFVAANARAREVHKTAEPAHALLGLDLPRGRDPLPEVLRHAARAPAVRPAQGASTCCWPRGSSTRSAATRCWPRRRARPWPSGPRAGAGLQHPQPGRARQLDHLHPHAGPRSAAAARLLPRQVRRGAGRRPRRARPARPSASPTWATATRRWCSARWAPWRWASRRSASRTAPAACRRRWSIWGARWRLERAAQCGLESDCVCACEKCCLAEHNNPGPAVVGSTCDSTGTPARVRRCQGAGIHPWRTTNATIRCSCFWP